MGPLHQALPQCITLEQLGDEVGLTVVETDVVKGDGVRVVGEPASLASRSKRSTNALSPPSASDTTLNVLMKEKRFDEAEVDLRQALDIRVKRLGEENVATQKAIKALADLYTAWGKPTQAAAYTARLAPAH